MAVRDDDVDARLLARVASGDRGALPDLYNRHRRPLYGYLARLAGDPAVAEEILQDTFVALWRSAGTFEGRSSAKTWIYGIARRQAHNRLRQRAADSLGDHELIVLPSGEPGPEDRALAGARRDTIAAAIDRLGPIQREILELAFTAELSYAEMAEVLQISTGTVKSRLSNAKRALAALLDEGAVR